MTKIFQPKENDITRITSVASVIFPSFKQMAKRLSRVDRICETNDDDPFLELFCWDKEAPLETLLSDGRDRRRPECLRRRTAEEDRKKGPNILAVQRCDGRTYAVGESNFWLLDYWPNYRYSPVHRFGSLAKRNHLYSSSISHDAMLLHQEYCLTSPIGLQIVHPIRWNILENIYPTLFRRPPCPGRLLAHWSSDESIELLSLDRWERWAVGGRAVHRSGDHYDALTSERHRPNSSNYCRPRHCPRDLLRLHQSFVAAILEF